MKQISIAIDGPSGAGKGTIANILAERLNYKHLNSGSIYRAIAYYFIQNKIEFNKFDNKILKNIKIKFAKNNDIILNNQNIQNKIRTPEMDWGASTVSKIKEIREFATLIQKELVLNDGGYIVEGRATAYELPEIELKIFLTASPEIRAKRRVEQYPHENYQKTLDEIKKRDLQDQSRETYPLKKHKDAIQIDNSNMSVEEQISLIIQLRNNKTI